MPDLMFRLTRRHFLLDIAMEKCKLTRMILLMQGIELVAKLVAGYQDSKKQKEFVAAMQERNWETAARMYGSIQDKQFQETKEVARAAAEQQRNIAEEQMFKESWPLLDSHLQLRRDFSNALENGTRLPLQIIMPIDVGALSAGGDNIPNGAILSAMRELANFMGANYAHQHGNLATAKIYTNCTKSPQTGYGTSQLHSIYEVFHVAPTLVLNPYCKGAHFCINCSYWDGSDTRKQWSPNFFGPVFSCSLSELQRAFLKDKAERWKSVREVLGMSNKEMETLSNLIDREKAACDAALSRGASQEHVNEFITPQFAKEYAELCKPFAEEISGYMSDMIAAACRLCTSLLSDLHYLLQESFPPRFARLCAAEIQRFPGVGEQADAIFLQSLQQRETSPYHRSHIPLWHAQLAQAYKGTAMSGFCNAHTQAGVNSLKQLLMDPASDTSWVGMPELRTAVSLLSVDDASVFILNCRHVLATAHSPQAPRSLPATAVAGNPNRADAVAVAGNLENPGKIPSPESDGAGSSEGAAKPRNDLPADNPADSGNVHPGKGKSKWRTFIILVVILVILSLVGLWPLSVLLCLGWLFWKLVQFVVSYSKKLFFKIKG